MRWGTWVGWLGFVAAWTAHGRASADVLSDIRVPFEAALHGGSYLGAVGLIFLAGLATSLTPCVYPMIAITVSVFGARQAPSRVQAAWLSTSFVLGIAALFTPLGIISALTGAAFGSALASPWVVGTLAAVFAIMALSMFGLFDLTLPSSVQARLARAGGFGARGAFALGFVNGLIAAPCTGPVLAVLLTWVATTGNVAFGALALFVYALGIGLLFWFVGTFAITLPKSGRWVEWTKSAFGIAMLALAFYYLRSLLPFPRPAVRDDLWLAMAMGLLVGGVLVGAIHLSFHQSAGAARIRKAIGVTACVAGILGIVGWAEALPPGSHIDWAEDFQAAKSRALNEERPMLIDFGADWCGACQELERDVLSDPRVVAAAQRFVTVRVDLSADEATDQKWALLKDYDQLGLPFVVMHHSDGSEAVRVTGLLESEEFLQMMSAVR
ncbi:MAG: cytochrome c biogenesis protein CcdA [Myxococcales bacterium]|jgi:thiol:disulfide interchange protein DsbD